MTNELIFIKRRKDPICFSKKIIINVMAILHVKHNSGYSFLNYFLFMIEGQFNSSTIKEKCFNNLG